MSLPYNSAFRSICIFQRLKNQQIMDIHVYILLRLSKMHAFDKADHIKLLILANFSRHCLKFALG